MSGYHDENGTGGPEWGDVLAAIAVATVGLGVAI